MLEGESLTIRAEGDAPDNAKYHALILQDTFYSRIMTIVNKIKCEEKFSYLRNLYSSFEDALKCDECSGVFEADCISFYCDHKFCKKCSIKMSACSLCTNPGYDRRSQHHRDFSSLLKNITTMQRDYNAESVIFNLIRYLIDPTGASVEEDLIKPPHQIANSNLSTLAVHMTARKKSAAKQTVQKSNDSDHFKRKVQPSPPRTHECDSDALFTNFKTDAAKTEKNTRSYLEQQESILSPKFGRNMKTYSRNAKRKLQCIEHDADSSSQEARLKKQKEQNNDRNNVNTLPKTRNLGRRNSLGLNGQSEAKEDVMCTSSVRKNRRKLSTESIESVSDCGPKGMFPGFERTYVVEVYNKLKSVRGRFKNFRAKFRPKNVIDYGADGIQENVTDESGSKANKRGPRRSSRFRNMNESLEKSPKIEIPVAESREISRMQSTKLGSQEDRANTLKNDEKSYGKLSSKRNLKRHDKTLEETEVLARKKKTVLEMNEKDINVKTLQKSVKEALKDISEKRVKVGAHEIFNHDEDEKEDIEVDHSKNMIEKENLGANTSDYDTEDVVDITSKFWGRNNRQTRKKKTLFNSLRERKKKNVLLKLLDEKKLQKEKLNQDTPTKKANDDVILDKIVEKDQSSLPTNNAINTINEEFIKEDSIKQKLLKEDSISPIQTSSSNAGWARKLSPGSGSTVTTLEGKIFHSGAENNGPLSLNNYTKLTTDETNILPHDAEKLSLKSSPQPIAEAIVGASSDIDHVQFVSDKISDKTTLSSENNHAEQVLPENDPKSILEETMTHSSDKDCAKQISPEVSPESVLEKTIESSPRLENTIGKSSKIENEVKREDISTPSLNKSKLHHSAISPMVGSRCSKNKSVSSPGFNLLTNTSTPLAKDGNKNCRGEEDENSSVVELSRENDDDTLKLNKRGSSHSGGNSPDEIADSEDTRYKLTIKRKCANLKRAINSQNQKSLVSLKKSFSVTSPQSLLIERMKTTRNSTDDYQAQNESFVDADPSEAGRKTNSVGNTSSCTLNASSSTNTKEVACQTSSDLHLALLAQEFPHLFRQSSLPLSVYDSPAQSDMKSNVGISSVVKTPEHLLRDDCDTGAKFSKISSITTSEKKRAETEFASHSILYDSLRTPHNFPSTNNSPADISSISFLPSTEKKISELVASGVDRRKLSVRLNFQSGTNLYSEQNGLIESPSTDPVLIDDEISPSKDEVLCSDDSVIYHSRKESCATEKLLPIVFSTNKSDEKRNGVSDISKEIGLAGTKENNEGTEKVEKNIRSTFNGERNTKATFTADLDFIPDSAVQIQDDVEIFKDEEKYKNQDPDDHKTPKKQNSDDDEDVDFIAATPTCNDKRVLEDDVEKVESRRSLFTSDEVDTQDEKSHPLFDTNPCQTTGPADTVHRDMSQSNDGAAVPSPRKPVSPRNANLSNLRRSTVNEKLICFASSGLKDADFRLIKAFCEKFPAIMQDKLTVESTHLIVKTDAENQASRTFKYLQAIVNNLTIVSIDWVAECLRHGYVVNEEKFIPSDSSGECGPLRAYNVAQGLTPSPLSWLRDYCVLFKEPIPQGCTLSQLQDIVRKTGAVVVDSLEEMDKYPRHHHVIIISDDDEEETGDITKYIKYWLQKYHAVAIEFNWLLEIIGRNRLVPFCDHEFAEIPEEILIRFKFPNEMLNSF